MCSAATWPRRGANKLLHPKRRFRAPLCAGGARDLLLFKPTAHDPEAVVRRFNLYTSESGVEEEFEPVGSSAKDGKAASLRERQI